jgi:hypothetical protein
MMVASSVGPCAAGWQYAGDLARLTRATKNPVSFEIEKHARCLALDILLAAIAADSNPDATFYKPAAEEGIAEVEMENLAMQKDCNQSVKYFGAMMVMATRRVSGGTVNNVDPSLLR